MIARLIRKGKVIFNEAVGYVHALVDLAGKQPTEVIVMQNSVSLYTRDNMGPSQVPEHSVRIVAGRERGGFEYNFFHLPTSSTANTCPESPHRRHCWRIPPWCRC